MEPLRAPKRYIEQRRSGNLLPVIITTVASIAIIAWIAGKAVDDQTSKAAAIEAEAEAEAPKVEISYHYSCIGAEGLRRRQSTPCEQNTLYRCIAADGRSWIQTTPCAFSSSETPRRSAPSQNDSRDAEIARRNREAELRIMAEADARYKREVAAARQDQIQHEQESYECGGLKAAKLKIQERMRRYGYGIKEGEHLDGRLREIFYRQNELHCRDR